MLGRCCLNLGFEKSRYECAPDPLAVPLGCPSALDDEEFEELRRGACPEDVSCLVNGDVVAEVSLVGELLGVASHTSESFFVDLLPEAGCFGVGLGGGADEEHDGCDPGGDLADEGAEGT